MYMIQLTQHFFHKLTALFKTKVALSRTDISRPWNRISLTLQREAEFIVLLQTGGLASPVGIFGPPGEQVSVEEFQKSDHILSFC